MRRLSAWATTAVVAITTAVAVSGSATAETRADSWRDLAVEAVDAFRAVDGGSEGVYAYAAMAEASGRLYGWDHAYTADYLAEVYALRNPDGGWGINRSWDAFSDGSTNPAGTTYAVTLADHVGPTLLAGYKAGVVPKSDVQTVVTLLAQMPRVPVSRGVCLAYSRQAADAKTGLCVHNVNAGAGSFLAAANAAGVVASYHKLIGDITVHEVGVYRTSDTWWPYKGDGGTLQDADHQSYSAQSMYGLAYWVGREATYRVLNTAYPAEVNSPLAHMRLVSTPGGISSAALYGEQTTLWCQMGDRWLAEASTYIAAPPSPAGQRLAQAALFAARNADACD